MRSLWRTFVRGFRDDLADDPIGWTLTAAIVVLFLGVLLWLEVRHA